jgi:hypothetical protein
MSEEIVYEWWLETADGERVTPIHEEGRFYEEDAAEAGQDMDDFASDWIHNVSRQTYWVKKQRKENKS